MIDARQQPHRWAAEIFSTGFWIALPLVAMLLFVTLVLALLSRVASQINIFAIGILVTLSVGLAGMMLMLPFMELPCLLAMDRVLARFR